MKKIIIPMLASACMLAGCTTTTIETDEWKVKSMSHWLKRDVDRLSVERTKDGYKVNVNGYRSDASEQLPAFTREMWDGIGILGRLAGSVFNPAVASVPLTSDPADANAIAQIQQSLANSKAAEAAAKAELAKAKAELAKAKAEAKAASDGDCPNGECGL